MTTPAQLVGTRIKKARQERGLTMALLAEQLQERLGGSWTAQRVSSLESAGSLPANPRTKPKPGEERKPARVDISATEIVALSDIFQKPPGWFFAPDDISDAVEMPAGGRLPALFLSQGSGAESDPDRLVSQL